MQATLMEESVVKKKDKPESKRQGTMIRVNDDFAEAFRKACALHGLSAAEFADMHFLPVVRRVYKDLLAKESKEMAGE